MPIQALAGPALVLVVAFVALVVDAFSTPARAVRATIATLLVAAAVSVWSAIPGPAVFAGAFVVGGGPAAIGALSAFLAALALLASSRRLALRANGGQVAALVAFSTFGAAVLVSAASIAVFVIALEVVALCGYALVGAAGTARAGEAAVKYVVQGAVATGVLAYGIAIVVGAFGGSVGYQPLPADLATRPVITALVLVIAALAFKLGAFPFHSWAPDAYETADAGIAGYLAAVPKLAALAALGVLLYVSFGTIAPVWTLLLSCLGAASIVFGNLAALRQRDFRRMLGYSGIAQVGYAFAALTGRFADLAPLLLFGAAYAVAASGAFFAAEAAGEGASWDGTVSGLAGLSKRRPLVAVSLAVCLLSLTGIPLTVGFWGKFAAFSMAAGSGYLWLAIVGVLGSVVSFGYYGGVLRAVFLDAPAAPPTEPVTEPVLAAEELESGLVPHSVGALAADDPEAPAPGWSPAATAVVAAAFLTLAAGIFPLLFGLGAFGVLARW
jgi:NADH-quinone oxidoreductase subunit N